MLDVGKGERMPIYEYGCKTCKNQFEVLIGMTEKHERIRCPRCGGKNVERHMSVVSIGRPQSQVNQGRMKALEKVNPRKPQEVARHFREHGSRFGDADFRGTKAWKDAVHRVAEGGPTLEDR
jgi:putative FmdB family regulatory protein